MTFFEGITAVFLFLGGGIMTMSLMSMRRLLPLFRENKSYKGWRFLFFFMLFFLGGYAVAFFLILLRHSELVLTLTGVIFFFGALFVFVVVRLGKSTVEEFLATAVSKAELEKAVAQRTEELDNAKYGLERLNLTKTDFIQVMAHELRTPLTVIQGYTQVLAENQLIKNDPEIKILFSGMSIGVARMYETINFLLDATKIESQAMAVNPMPLLPAMIVEGVQRQLDEALQERNITLELIDLKELPAIYADSGLMSKLFYHLISNAIKYTPDGGSVTVTGKALGEWGMETAVEIIVSDTGIGIDPLYHEVIFEKFYRTGEISLHSSGRTKFKGGGTGLGLAIAKGIVAAHHGKIWVESEKHDEETFPGSNFHVWLPTEAVTEE